MNTLNLQIKPVGSSCNLLCHYPCYALPFRIKSIQVMSDDILEKVISEICFVNSPSSEIVITWHGGEPLLAGMNYYQKALSFFYKYRKENQSLRHKMQTNGTLLNREWASFLFDNNFEIGISIDGPQEIHDMNRKYYGSERGSFVSAMKGLKFLRQANIYPSVIATVTIDTLKYVDEVFRFLVDNDFVSIKYSPVFDPKENIFSVSSDQWFNYLSRVFDLWFEHGDPDISILDLDEVIAWLDGTNISMCSSEQSCLGWITVEPNGQLGPCAYFGEEISYGNIQNTSFSLVRHTSPYKKFLKNFLSPPPQCQQCQFFKQCGNGCPATRLTNGYPDSSGLYVYCQERQRLYQKIKVAFADEVSKAN